MRRYPDLSSGEFAVWSAKKQIWIAPISGKEKAKLLTFARVKTRRPNGRRTERKSPSSPIAGITDLYSVAATGGTGHSTLKSEHNSCGVAEIVLAITTCTGLQIVHLRQANTQQRCDVEV